LGRGSEVGCESLVSAISASSDDDWSGVCRSGRQVGLEFRDTGEGKALEDLGGDWGWDWEMVAIDLESLKNRKYP
jgi:hypothetical protein